MTKVNDGGPAFPSQTDTFRTPDGRAATRCAESGMTLRDAAAFAALPTIIARGEWGEWDQLANLAYEMADAMLRARESGQ